MGESEKKQKVLIVDDYEDNREMLSDILGDKYDIIQATNGVEAISVLEKDSAEISVVLLDLNMPVMDGYAVLDVMNKKGWIDVVSVLIISAENSLDSMRLAFDLGVKDFINRPFDYAIVRHRVLNALMLSAKNKKLEEMVYDQIKKKEKVSRLMINILSHIVEFRNGESGAHVLHVQTYTDILLRQLIRLTDKYNISKSDISLITKAAALHDIGKISIPDHILNKPGRFTDEEYAIMKTHSSAGATMLKELPHYQNEPLVKVAYEICRWHHERYDGRGYPDGIKEDEIPISAQIVALADVYDALTSERVYKAAFSHEKAMEMILNGECGCFNPLLLECLKQSSDAISRVKRNDNASDENQKESNSYELMQYEEFSESEEMLHMLEHERMKNDFYASISNELHFEYVVYDTRSIDDSDKIDKEHITPSSIISVNPNENHIFGLDKPKVYPIYDENLISDKIKKDLNKADTNINSVVSRDDLDKIDKMLRATSPQSPMVQYECKIHVNDETHKINIICRSVWKNKTEFHGAIGKIADLGIE